VSGASKDSEPKKVPRRGMFAAGTIVALIISVPAIVAFLVAWKYTGNVLTGLIVSVVVYFIAMGLSFKVSKKIKIVSED